MIHQVSSNCFQRLNISLVNDNGDLHHILARCRPDLRVIDEHLRGMDLVNFQRLTLGVPEGFIHSIQDYFPRAAVRGFVHVMSVKGVDDLPDIVNGRNSFPMKRLV